MKRVLKGSGIVVLGIVALCVGLNLNSLDDGIQYLQDMFAYVPVSAQPLDPKGRFGFCEQFATLRNAQRAQFIVNFLEARGIAFQRLPIYDTKFDNIFAPFARRGNESESHQAAVWRTIQAFVPYTIFSAHYDKVYDDPDYQGASDNSAAVCMLLVAAEELNRARPPRPVAILFTGQEEVGLVGARAFYDYATENNLQVADVLNFDNIGRAGLAARASGERSGYVFTIPLWGEFVYDGRKFSPASAYRQPDARLMQQLQRVGPIKLYDRMVAQSDGTYWQERGWNAVNLTSDNIYYLDETWHTYGDRVELLEQDNFQRALELVLGYARQEQ